MQVQAKLYGVRLSAQKGRLVADLVRGQPIASALNILAFTPKKGAKIIKKVLESAIANAEHNNGADIDELKVQTIYVEQGATLKRFSARAKGRGNRHPVSPWGQPAKGKKTRTNKRTQVMIVRSRHKKA